MQLKNCTSIPYETVPKKKSQQCHNTTHNEHIMNRTESFHVRAAFSCPLPTVAAISEVLPLIFLLGGSGLDGIQHFVLCSHFLRGPVG